MASGRLVPTRRNSESDTPEQRERKDRSRFANKIHKRSFRVRLAAKNAKSLNSEVAIISEAGDASTGPCESADADTTPGGSNKDSGSSRESNRRESTEDTQPELPVIENHVISSGPVPGRSQQPPPPPPPPPLFRTVTEDGYIADDEAASNGLPGIRAVIPDWCFRAVDQQLQQVYDYRTWRPQ